MKMFYLNSFDAELKEIISPWQLLQQHFLFVSIVLIACAKISQQGRMLYKQDYAL
jgi:hypothetical protein